MKFEPHEYQAYAIEYILQHPVAALFLDCGLGKTVITLTAVKELLDRGEVKRVLVVAPLRVARDVWPAEVKKWDHLHGLQMAVAVGSGKRRTEALESDAQVWVTNRENLSWVVQKRWTRAFFDMVILDELSSFKNFSAQRTRAAFRLCQEAKRIVGLTGTPAANSLMDLWSEFRILDGGERLGKFLSGYQNKYFSAVYSLYGNYVRSWRLKEGAEQQIYEAIGDITISMKALDHLQMPELITVDHPVRLSKTEYRQYEKMTQEMALSLPGGEITAVNAVALATKLTQLAGGMAYGRDGTALKIHSRKLDALEDLLEAANGKPVLVVYNFRHDLERIEALLKEKGLPFARLDSGESIQEWNSGELAAGLINPASAGHGLNLQEGGNTIIWYSLPWSLELYQQTNARLYRQGQKEKTVVVHHILTPGTIDEKIRAVLMRKDRTQAALIEAVKAELGRGTAA